MYDIERNFCCFVLIKFIKYFLCYFIYWVDIKGIVGDIVNFRLVCVVFLMNLDKFGEDEYG